MKKRVLTFRPTKTVDLDFEDLYSEFSRDWLERAEKLRIRRWRALRHKVKVG